MLSVSTPKTSAGPGYAYIWKYSVRSEHVGDFVAAYGPNGDWVQLFRRFKGYCQTVLLRDRGDPLVFVTIDYWRCASDWETFRKKAGVEFESLDSRCEQWTKEERELGRYDASYSASV